MGTAAMTAISQVKTPQQTRLEGLALTALFQGFPTYAGAVLLLKLIGAHEIVGERFGAIIFVVVTSLLHGLLTPWLVPKLPARFRQGYEPVFFNATLSFSDKITQWRIQPNASLQLVTNVILLSVLAVGVASMG
jgi:hypothetical protein